MDPISLVNVLLHCLSNAPKVAEDFRSVIHANWDHDLVTDAKQGLEMLGKLVADVAGEKAPADPAVETLQPQS